MQKISNTCRKVKIIVCDRYIFDNTLGGVLSETLNNNDENESIMCKIRHNILKIDIVSNPVELYLKIK